MFPDSFFGSGTELLKGGASEMIWCASIGTRVLSEYHQHGKAYPRKGFIPGYPRAYTLLDTPLVGRLVALRWCVPKGPPLQGGAVSVKTRATPV